MTYAESAGALSSAAIEKEQRLIEWLHGRGAIAIGYSGGVDSAYLAAVAVDALGAERVLGIIGRSASYPESQWSNARAIAERIGLPVVEIDTDELSDPRYAANPTNRCYFCKTELWTRLAPVARARGIATLCDGTNADDVHDYRPGAQAAREHEIASPLALAGMTKLEIRDRSRARGLESWSQPSSPCLSSRLPYGTPVTAARLKRVERAEDALRGIGVTGDLRVRHFGSRARVELAPRELARWSSAEMREQLRAAVIATGYRDVEIDPRGFRSGALNELASIAATPTDRASRAAVSGD